MFDPAWLDTRDEDELHRLYNECRWQEKHRRSIDQWGLATWWGRGAVEICDALGRLYLEKHIPSFNRSQISMDGMPSRIAPELRLLKPL